MSVLEILAAARKAGIRLSLDGDKVIAESPDEVPAEVVEAIRAAKPDLLRVLRDRNSRKALAAALEEDVGIQLDGDDFRLEP
jgi:hypothetical protein